jgi:hypothetical protein
MANISDVLTDSLILVGAYAQGQTPNTDDMSLAYRVINRKLDSLSAEKLSMVGMQRKAYPLTGAAFYPFGPGLTWAPTNRPVKIKSASTLSAFNTEHPARLSTADQWAMVDDKSRTGVYIEDLFWDAGYPAGNIYVSPMPASGSCILWTFEAIPLLPAQTGTVSLAPGYEQAIVDIAAVELCIAFQRPVTQELMLSATQAKQVIIELNAELFGAPAPPPAGPGPTSAPATKVT